MKYFIKVKSKALVEIELENVILDGYFNDNEIKEYLKENYCDKANWCDPVLKQIDYEIIEDWKECESENDDCADWREYEDR